jgi:lysophospholipase L1-like esterase
MRILQTILIMMTALSACAKKAEVHATNNDTVVHSQPVTDSITYLALGDSYTVGEAEPPAESFPYQLRAALRANTYECATPYIIATTGWTTDDLIAAIASSSINNKKYDFVTLLIGVNDQYQGLSQENYKVKFAQVLNTAINFAEGDSTRVFVLSIPDWGVTPYAAGQDSIIGPQIDQFNAINKAISLAAGVNYLDITAISREAATDPTLVAPDGLHPSAKMYALWVNLLEPMVRARLKKN